MKKLFCIVAALSLLTVAGCSGDIATPAPVPAVVDSPLRSPIQLTSVAVATIPGPTVTPDPSKATIEGTVKVKMNGQTVPLRSIILYLGGTVSDTQGNKAGVAFDRITSPRAITDNTGRFIFRNIKPGEYGLVLDVIHQSFMMRAPSDGKDMLMTVAAGETKDFGVLTYDSLPITPTP